jgi:hypothetical protein
LGNLKVEKKHHAFARHYHSTALHAAPVFAASEPVPLDEKIPIIPKTT